MTDDKVIEACDGLKKLIEGSICFFFNPHRLGDHLMNCSALELSEGAPESHLLFMCDEIKSLIAQGRREKAMRWLGFVQGTLWGLGLASIDQMKKLNKPDEAKS